MREYICTLTGEVLKTKNRIRAYRYFKDCYYATKWKNVMPISRYNKMLDKLGIS
jgi:hypothetical protein